MSKPKLYLSRFIILVFIVLFSFSFAFFLRTLHVIGSLRPLGLNGLKKDSFSFFNSNRRLLLKRPRPITGRLAWCIPVGGKTHRLKLLKEIVTSLHESGVSRQDIYVFEDNGSRSSSVSKKVYDFVKNELKTNLVRSNIVRNRLEKGNEFGLFLARHYHFMLDAVLFDGVSGPEDLEVGGFGSSKPPYVSDVAFDIRMSHEDDMKIPHEDDMKIPHENKRIPHEDDMKIPHENKRIPHEDDVKIEEGTTSHFRKDERFPRWPIPRYKYAVMLEDDLELSKDAVSFFQGASDVMDIDDTIFCACAHVDNGFYATSAEDYGKFPFHLKRGSHFMAPGFMVSGHLYNSGIRATWLDTKGDVLLRERFHMPNGNWDTFFDSYVNDQKKECIFPSVPRIAHRGTTGYTVNADYQSSIFDR